ncbi:MAG: thiamine pyrophosphate-binding protein [Verrucomicrobia bacterium]|nr:thiamine pyrophosphate-binding protein [Verrucomicrobiota bacterium]
MTVADYFVQFLKQRQVSCVFQLSGGMIMHLIDALHQDGGIQMINVHHEQTSGFAAEVVGRLSGRPGVAIATSGPGALNLLGGIASSYFDSSPAVYITGQVNTHEQKANSSVRQLGFQETDIVRMAAPISKMAVKVTRAVDVPRLLNEAFAVATAGRPGPVLLDLPMNLARAFVAGAEPMRAACASAGPESQDDSAVVKVYEAILCGGRPMILAGHGVRLGGAASALRSLSEKLRIPVVHSLLASDCIPYHSPVRFGMIGTYGNRWANHALAVADPLIVIGSRLDIRQTGADTSSFKGQRTIFHIDVELTEINNRVPGCCPVLMDAKTFLDGLCRVAEEQKTEAKTEWLETIESWRRQWPDTEENKSARGINPNILMHKLSENRKVAAYCVDVGLHQMWAGQSLEIYDEQRFITSGGLGAMGFALPAAVGAAAFYRNTQPVMVIAGDAGFQLNIQELQTIRRYGMPVKMVVVNNGCHGMTRHFQDSYFSSRYPGTVWGYDAPSFAHVARAYGIRGLEAENMRSLTEAIEAMWRDPLEPILVDVKIDPAMTAYPKIAFGKPINQMEPMARPNAMGK